MNLTDEELYEIAREIEQTVSGKVAGKDLLAKYPWDPEMIEQVESFMEQRAQGFQYVHGWAQENFFPYKTRDIFDTNSGVQTAKEKRASLQKMLYRVVRMLAAQKDLLEEVVEPAVREYVYKQEDPMNVSWMTGNLEEAWELLEEAIDSIGEVGHNIYTERRD